MSDVVVQLLFLISWALLYPTMILLLLGLLWSFVLAGGFLAEAWGRVRGREDYRSFIDALSSQGGSHETEAVRGAPHLVKRALEAMKQGQDPEKTLGDLEIVARRALGKLSIGIRVGPILGLAGTLIPLGPALVALSAGDTQTLSEKLVVAFSTSVVGLFISGLCYVMHNFRRSWYAQDLHDVDYLFSRKGKA